MTKIAFTSLAAAAILSVLTGQAARADCEAHTEDATAALPQLKLIQLAQVNTTQTSQSTTTATKTTEPATTGTATATAEVPARKQEAAPAPAPEKTVSKAKKDEDFFSSVFDNANGGGY